MDDQPEAPARPVDRAARPADPPEAAPAETGRLPRAGAARKKRAANRLLILSSAAVLAVYGIGYARTEPAARAADTGQAAAGIAATPAAAPSRTAIAALPTQPAQSALPAPTTPATRQPAPARLPPASAGATLRDGTYVGSGTSRHGGIEATVVVKGGAIVSAEITRCGTRYPCSKIAMLPGQVVSRQSVNVDMVSGATDSSRAYQAAVAAALAKAR
jgi:uncharacterized protein with FMN-binding domain